MLYVVVQKSKTPDEIFEFRSNRFHEDFKTVPTFTINLSFK